MAVKVVRVKVPEIMEARGLTWEDLAYHASLSQPTARIWSDPEKAQELKAITFETLINIAEYLNVSLEALLEIVDKEPS